MDSELSRSVRARSRTVTLFKERPIEMLTVTGSGDAAAAIAVGLALDSGWAAGAAAVVGIAIAVILVFMWALLTEPRHQLEQRVEELRSEVAELATLVRPEPGVMRITLRLVREEVRDSLRILTRARDTGTYWKLTETSPDTKQWKKHRTLLLEMVSDDDYEQLRVAAQEVDRINTARSMGTVFKRDTKVHDDNRVPETVLLLVDVEARLSAALQGVEAG